MINRYISQLFACGVSLHTDSAFLEELMAIDPVASLVLQ